MVFRDFFSSEYRPAKKTASMSRFDGEVMEELGLSSKAVESLLAHPPVNDPRGNYSLRKILFARLRSR